MWPRPYEHYLMLLINDQQSIKSCSCATDNGNDVGYLRPTAPSPVQTDTHIYGQPDFEGEFTNDS